MGLFDNKYPYTDFHELNLDFVLETITKLQADMTDFIKYNEIKFNDPIEWNITTQYTANTVVTNNGTAYLSKQAVPAGIDIENTDYWLAIGIFNVSIDTFRANITVYNEVANARASRAYAVGSVIWWHDNLYYVIEQIVQGDILGESNLEQTSVMNEIDREKTERNNAISAAISQEVIDRNDAISSAIDTEVSNRNSAISEAIATEVENRDSAIEDAVDNAIITEVINRNNAISTAISNTKLGDLKNVNVAFPINGQVLKYDLASGTWVNANESGGGSASLDIIASEYSAEIVYNPGQYCVYLGNLYRKIGTSEQSVIPTTIESWTQTTVGEEFDYVIDKTKFHIGDRIYLVKDKSVNGCVTMLFGKTSGIKPRIYIPINKPLDSNITGASVHGYAYFGISDSTSGGGFLFSDSTTWSVSLNPYNLQVSTDETVSPTPYSTKIFPTDNIFAIAAYGSSTMPADYRDVYIEFT